jgi:hypothetical protein
MLIDKPEAVELSRAQARNAGHGFLFSRADWLPCGVDHATLLPLNTPSPK